MAATREQLSFDVGGEAPSEGTLKVSGTVFVDRELPKGEEVHLQLVDSDGGVVANGYGRVIAVTFRDTLEEGIVVSTERLHTVKVT